VPRIKTVEQVAVVPEAFAPPDVTKVPVQVSTPLVEAVVQEAVVSEQISQSIDLSEKIVESDKPVPKKIPFRRAKKKVEST
jgi:hypothetical protein